MANIDVFWTPASGITGQRVFAKEKASGTWISSNFNLPNDQSPSANTATYQAAIANRVYQFKINSICTGGVLSVDSPIGEGIVFECFNTVITNVTDTTITVQTTGIHSDITGFSFYLFENNGTTIVSSSPVLIPSGGTVTHTFTGLTPNHPYKLNTQATVSITNGGSTYDVYSSPYDTPCYLDVTTDNTATTQLNPNILISNGSGNLVSGTYPLINMLFEGDAGSGYVVPPNYNPLNGDYIGSTAGAYPVSTGGVGPALYGPAACATPNANGIFNDTTLGDSGGGGYTIRVTLDNSPGGGSGGPFGTSTYQLRIVDALNNTQIQPVIPGTTVYTFTGVQDYELVSAPKTCGIEVYLELIPTISSNNFLVTGNSSSLQINDISVGGAYPYIINTGTYPVTGGTQLEGYMGAPNTTSWDISYAGNGTITVYINAVSVFNQVVSGIGLINTGSISMNLVDTIEFSTS